MIERIYIDNYKSLVNFEWKPRRFELLMGDNGTGKSAVVDALWGLRAIATRSSFVRNWFPGSSRCRWAMRPETTLELDARLDGDLHRYRVVIEHATKERKRTRVKFESYTLNSQLKYEFKEGKFILHADDGRQGPEVALDARRTALGALGNSDEPQRNRLCQFLLAELSLFRPDPRAMFSFTTDESETVEEAPGGPDADGELLPNVSNFSIWLPPRITEDFKRSARATSELGAALPGFQELAVNPATKHLEARFSSDSGSEWALRFDELSEGQRQLCVLYFLRHLAVRKGRLAIFDEFENYLALSEVQPWLNSITDAATTADGPQVWLISHHPEVFDQLAPSRGTRFFRDGGVGPTRIEPFRGMAELSPSELVARGWDNDQ